MSAAPPGAPGSRPQTATAPTPAASGGRVKAAPQGRPPSPSRGGPPPSAAGPSSFASPPPQGFASKSPPTPRSAVAAARARRFSQNPQAVQRSVGGPPPPVSPTSYGANGQGQGASFKASPQSPLRRGSAPKTPVGMKTGPLPSKGPPGAGHGHGSANPDYRGYPASPTPKTPYGSQYNPPTPSQPHDRERLLSMVSAGRSSRAAAPPTSPVPPSVKTPVSKGGGGGGGGRPRAASSVFGQLHTTQVVNTPPQAQLVPGGAPAGGAPAADARIYCKVDVDIDTRSERLYYKLHPASQFHQILREACQRFPDLDYGSLRLEWLTGTGHRMQLNPDGTPQGVRMAEGKRHTHTLLVTVQGDGGGTLPSSPPSLYLSQDVPAAVGGGGGGGAGGLGSRRPTGRKGPPSPVPARPTSPSLFSDGGSSMGVPGRKAPPTPRARRVSSTSPPYASARRARSTSPPPSVKSPARSPRGSGAIKVPHSPPATPHAAAHRQLEQSHEFQRLEEANKRLREENAALLSMNDSLKATQPVAVLSTSTEADTHDQTDPAGDAAADNNNNNNTRKEAPANRASPSDPPHQQHPSASDAEFASRQPTEAIASGSASAPARPDASATASTVPGHSSRAGVGAEEGPPRLQQPQPTAAVPAAPPMSGTTVTTVGGAHSDAPAAGAAGSGGSAPGAGADHAPQQPQTAAPNTHAFDRSVDFDLSLDIVGRRETAFGSVASGPSSRAAGEGGAPATTPTSEYHQQQQQQQQDGNASALSLGAASQAQSHGAAANASAGAHVNTTPVTERPTAARLSPMRGGGAAAPPPQPAPTALPVPPQSHVTWGAPGFEGLPHAPSPAHVRLAVGYPQPYSMPPSSYPARPSTGATGTGPAAYYPHHHDPSSVSAPTHPPRSSYAAPAPPPPQSQAHEPPYSHPAGYGYGHGPGYSNATSTSYSASPQARKSVAYVDAPASQSPAHRMLPAEHGGGGDDYGSYPPSTWGVKRSLPSQQPQPQQHGSYAAAGHSLRRPAARTPASVSYSETPPSQVVDGYPHEQLPPPPPHESYGPAGDDVFRSAPVEKHPAQQQPSSHAHGHTAQHHSKRSAPRPMSMPVARPYHASGPEFMSTPFDMPSASVGLSRGGASASYTPGGGSDASNPRFWQMQGSYPGEGGGGHAGRREMMDGSVLGALPLRSGGSPSQSTAQASAGGHPTASAAPQEQYRIAYLRLRDLYDAYETFHPPAVGSETDKLLAFMATSGLPDICAVPHATLVTLVTRLMGTSPHKPCLTFEEFADVLHLVATVLFPRESAPLQVLLTSLHGAHGDEHLLR